MQKQLPKRNLNAPVFLACEQVERVLCSQEVVIIQNLYGRHPVGVAVFGDLITPEIANVFNQNSTFCSDATCDGDAAALQSVRSMLELHSVYLQNKCNSELVPTSRSINSECVIPTPQAWNSKCVAPTSQSIKQWACCTHLPKHETASMLYPPPQTVPLAACRPAAWWSASGRQPAQSHLSPSRTGRWCCWSCCTPAAALSQPSTQTAAPATESACVSHR